MKFENMQLGTYHTCTVNFSICKLFMAYKALFKDVRNPKNLLSSLVVVLWVRRGRTSYLLQKVTFFPNYKLIKQAIEILEGLKKHFQVSKNYNAVFLENTLLLTPDRYNISVKLVQATGFKSYTVKTAAGKLS